MPDADFGDNIWDAFDDLLERAREALAGARENKRVIDFTDEPLPEVYSVALQEIELTIDDFDSVYDVTEDVLEEVKEVASQASLLEAVTGAYRRYHESLIERRVVVAAGWFDKLDSALDNAGITVDIDRETLSKRRKVLEKFVETDRFGQLLPSDRVSLESFESDIEDLNDMACEDLEPRTYIGVGEAITQWLTNKYTDDLSELTSEDVDPSVISVTDRLEESPDIDPIIDRNDDDGVSEEDAITMAEAVQATVEIATFTGQQRADYILGKDLISAIDTSTLFEYGETSDLRSHLTSLNVQTIESVVSTVIEREVTTPEEDQFRQLLAENDGSVRQTARVSEKSTEDMFQLLQELYENGDIVDLEARFE